MSQATDWYELHALDAVFQCFGNRVCEPDQVDRAMKQACKAATAAAKRYGNKASDISVKEVRLAAVKASRHFFVKGH
jgi:hypothetical protein